MMDELEDGLVPVAERDIIDKADTLKFFAGKLYGYIDALEMNNNIDKNVSDSLKANIDVIVYTSNRMYEWVYEDWSGELD